MSSKNDNLFSDSMDVAVFNKIINGLNAGVYVTDIDTDEIIFINDTMKRDFNLEAPEGQICWKVLQKGRKERCDFCPVDRLCRQKNREFVYRWDEVNALTKRSYRNFDSLITWMDGRTVHLQQSIDVSELKSANTDELTQFLTRRAGKETLKAFLERGQKEDFIITICLYDINLIKEVNSRYGHVVGDRMIVTISDVVRSSLRESEFVFRLDADAFVAVFSCGIRDAKMRMLELSEQLRQKSEEYELSFCYGLAEATLKKCLTIDEMIFLADKRMYEQKRSYHIEANARKLQGRSLKQEPDIFEYDAERLYEALVQSTEDYIYVCNMKTGVFKYPKTMVEEFELPGEVIANAAAVWGNKVHEDDKTAFLESNQEISDGHSTSHCVEYRAKDRNGEWVWVRCRGHVELDESGEPSLFAGFITNLGKKNKIDHLTGIPNKLEFGDQLRHLIASEQSFSVMKLGIDGLKHINDLYNREFGDEVIRIASQKLQSLLPAEASIYRLDGDEFGVVMRGAARETMDQFYRIITHRFQNQQIYKGNKYYCTLSAGCLFYPQDTEDYNNVVKYVGYCLEYSKTHGKKQCTYFSPDILDKRAYALEMVELLRESVENNFNGFSLMYQPLVEAGSGRLLGVEALARWQCEKFGGVSPMEFIPLLESSGLIADTGKWVLQTAVNACKKWVEADPDFVIDVNVSYVQIQDSDFFSYVQNVMREESFLPKNLVLELTESYFVTEHERLKGIFEEIRGMGVRIAMDDFGTGYSTLAILKECPADIVKIDKAFIRNINASQFDATFIRFVVELCHTVGIEVCLEGVETKDTYDIVSLMGLDIIQGYLFDKPLTEDAFTDKYFGSTKTV